MVFYCVVTASVYNQSKVIMAQNNILNLSFSIITNLKVCSGLQKSTGHNSAKVKIFEIPTISVKDLQFSTILMEVTSEQNLLS